MRKKKNRIYVVAVETSFKTNYTDASESRNLTQKDYTQRAGYLYMWISLHGKVHTIW